MEVILQVLAEFVLEVIVQILVEGVASLGWKSVEHNLRPESTIKPWLASIGHLVLGVAAGFLTLLGLKDRLLPRSPVPGLSLLLSPFATGLVMEALGTYWEDARERPALFSFRAGAIFAFGMALVRFVFVGHS